MAAPTNAANVKKALANSEPSTHGTQGTPAAGYASPAAAANSTRCLACFPNPFWWSIAIASLLSLARFSQAFLVLKAYDIGIDAAFVPMMLVPIYIVYACAAYPFGILADHIDRRAQLGMGASVLMVRMSF